VFEELMPLLTRRVLVVTLSRVSREEICVNVIPKPQKSDQQDDDAALTTPLSSAGAPKELDEQLSRQLVEFVDSPGAVLNLEEGERTDGDCRQSSTGSSQEINSYQVPWLIRQERYSGLAGKRKQKPRTTTRKAARNRILNKRRHQRTVLPQRQDE
jgi:PRTRC genetic system protein E